MNAACADAWVDTELLGDDEPLSFGQKFPLYMDPRVMLALLREARARNRLRRVERDLRLALRGAK